MSAAGPKFSDSVFINCPFDPDYWPIFEAIVFTIVDSGFVPRSSLQNPDSGEVRVRRIHEIINSSQYSIHDISRVQLTPNYPRFNMPFELGLDIGCKRFGNSQMKRKRCLILDSEQFRYQEFFSDIAGQDIKAHGNSPNTVIGQVRNWLMGASKRKSVPGPQTIRKHFSNFSAVLPAYCDRLGLDRNDILFPEYVTMIEEWLKSANK